MLNIDDPIPLSDRPKYTAILPISCARDASGRVLDLPAFTAYARAALASDVPAPSPGRRRMRPPGTKKHFKQFVQETTGRTLIEAAVDDPFADEVAPVPFVKLRRLARANGRRLARRPEPSHEPGAAVAVTLDVPETEKELAVKRRFVLQEEARCLLPRERVAGCLRHRVPDRETVSVYFAPGSGTCSLGDLQLCGSVWMCPVCAAKISEKRRVQLGADVAAGRALGFKWVMVTYTVQHRQADKLEWLLNGGRPGKEKLGLNGARSRLTAGKGQRIYEKHGVYGSVRNKEITWGFSAGYHPHIHELLLVAADCDPYALATDLASAWSVAVVSAGLRPVNEHGVKVSDTYEAIEQYITKYGHEPNWNLEHEMAKQVTKKGREAVEGQPASFTPMQLLALSADMKGSDLGELAGEKWREFARAMKGERQLFYSPKLRKVLGLTKEKTDAELVEQHDEPGLLGYEADDDEWLSICFSSARGEFLAVCARAFTAAGVTLTQEAAAQSFSLQEAKGVIRSWTSGLLSPDRARILRGRRSTRVPSPRLRDPEKDRKIAAWLETQDAESAALSELSPEFTEYRDYMDYGGGTSGLSFDDFRAWRAGDLQRLAVSQP